MTIKERINKAKTTVVKHVKEHWLEDILLLVGTGASVYTAVNGAKRGDELRLVPPGNDDDGDLNELSDLAVEEPATV